jgi:hypothetical protein
MIGLNNFLFTPLLISFFRTSSLPPSNKGAFRFFTSNNELQDQRKRLASSDDEDLHLKEDDLKQKLKEEKRQGRKNGELLTKLQENYEELLEKYAQAENTIDQLRFQPKIFGDNTPKASTSEVIQSASHSFYQISFFLL